MPRVPESPSEILRSISIEPRFCPRYLCEEYLRSPEVFPRFSDFFEDETTPETGTHSPSEPSSSEEICRIHESTITEIPEGWIEYHKLMNQFAGKHYINKDLHVIVFGIEDHNILPSMVQVASDFRSKLQQAELWEQVPKDADMIIDAEDKHCFYLVSHETCMVFLVDTDPKTGPITVTPHPEEYYSIGISLLDHKPQSGLPAGIESVFWESVHSELDYLVEELKVDSSSDDHMREAILQEIAWYHLILTCAADKDYPSFLSLLTFMSSAIYDLGCLPLLFLDETWGHKLKAAEILGVPPALALIKEARDCHHGNSE
ncbi:hypothetical protein CERSUDRAFT_91028 [Gelatoporia subvermispora B]|uniref:Uncharacterized protein n=1 Tax=Ceriporiopsis subvermispora (strain B) TaxID=914234 RepID=M2PUA2_CERS8|nr:hypothetical protein CERSUDRAFT_91028 [Gelatoporia subvermispora B]